MLRLVIQTGNDLMQREHREGPLEIGRGPQQSAPRVMLGDPHVSRDHLRLEETDEGSLRIENISRKNAVQINDAQWLDVGGVVLVPLPATLRIGATSVQIERHSATVPELLHTVRQPFAQQVVQRAPTLRELGEVPSAEVLTGWFERVLAVQRAAAGSDEFYLEAARAVVELVGLDRSCVLLRKGEGWQVVARYPAQAVGEFEFSQSVLNQVEADRRTFYQTFHVPSGSRSLRQIEAVVASPILDELNQALGILYGSREHALSGETENISAIEAQVVQLLAAAVGAGLTRLDREAQAARLRVQFEQFFSPMLARELERDPSLLQAREREITVLFADVRGFAVIAEQVGPQETFRLMADVLDRLTARIQDFGGVIIDYYGDGVAVMWNAPADQPDHARLACQAALALRTELPSLNETWSGRLGCPLELGIGVHSGPALVGNSGSSRRIKYGPRGHTVNLASRLEQATRQFGVPILISGNTGALLDDAFSVRRLCRARLYGVTTPLELYELLATGHPGESQLVGGYEQALGRFESGDLQAAEAELSRLAEKGDGPAALLLRYVQSRQQSTTGVVELSEK